jgi:surface antigen
MKRGLVFTWMTILLMFMLSGCGMKEYMVTRHEAKIALHNNQNDTSQILASRLFFGSNQRTAAAGGKLLFDYLLDEPIGQYMDWKDIIYMQNAVLNTPIHSSYMWKNKRRGVTYTVKLIQLTYGTQTHRYCRRYALTVKAQNEIEKTFGLVCHDLNGQWHVM